MSRPIFVPRALAVAAALVSLGSATLSAQVANPSAAQVGMANTRAVLARNYEAISLNPAALGMPGNSKWSLSIASGSAAGAGGPVGYTELMKYQQELIPVGVKEDWVARIEGSGNQSIEGEAAISLFAMTWKRFGLEVSGSGILLADLNADAAELMLFGNAGRTGAPADFDMGASATNNAGVGNVALAYGQPLKLRIGGSETQHSAIGATLHYTQAMFLVNGSNAGTRITADPVELEIQFPIVIEGFDGVNNLGSGVGLDLSGMWSDQTWSVSLGVRNIFNSFKFDLEKMEFRPASAVFSGDTVGVTRFDPRPMTEAPEELQAAIEQLSYDPIADLSVAYQATSSWLLTGAFRHRFESFLETTPRSYGGVGAQYSGLTRWLTLHGGVGTFGSRSQFSAGVGLDWIGLRLELAALRRIGGDANDQTIFGVTFGYHAEPAR
jgi:hypothetical protein